MTDTTSTGGMISSECRLIELRVSELKQIFNEMDPSPFRERDLDPSAEEFIVGWARELPAKAPLALVVHLDRPAGPPEEAALLRDAVGAFFRQRTETTRVRLRELFRRGRTSLVIGLFFMALTFGTGDLVATALDGTRLAEFMRESLIIGGWVAMWRPLEIFLYDWWPIWREARLYERLASMPVRIHYAERGGPDAWRRDWPAVSSAAPRAGA